MLVARTVGWRPGGSTAVAHVHVVAVEGDVERADGELRPAALRDEPAQPRRERRAARLDPDERDTTEPVSGLAVALDDLVRDAGESLRDRLSVEEEPRGGVFGDVRRHLAPFRPRWTGLKAGSVESRRRP